jgi:hypothetical protein
MNAVAHGHRHYHKSCATAYLAIPLKDSLTKVCMSNLLEVVFENVSKVNVSQLLLYLVKCRVGRANAPPTITSNHLTPFYKTQ